MRCARTKSCDHIWLVNYNQYRKIQIKVKKYSKHGFGVYNNSYLRGSDFASIFPSFIWSAQSVLAVLSWVPVSATSLFKFTEVLGVIHHQMPFCSRESSHRIQVFFSTVHAKSYWDFRAPHSVINGPLTFASSSLNLSRFTVGISTSVHSIV